MKIWTSCSHSTRRFPPMLAAVGLISASTHTGSSGTGQSGRFMCFQPAVRLRGVVRIAGGMFSGVSGGSPDAS